MSSTTTPPGVAAVGDPAQPPGPGHPAGSLPRGVVVLLGLAGLVAAVAGLRGISSLFGPVFLGVVLVVAVHPLHRLIDRILPSWVAVAVSLVAVYAVVLGLLASLGYAVARLATTLPTYSAAFQRSFNQVIGLLSRYGVNEKQITSAVSSISPSRVISVVQGLYGQVSGALSGLTLLVTVVVFLVADSGSIPHRLDVLAGTKPLIARSLRDFASGTRRYLVVTTVFGLIVAVLDTIALIVLDVPLAYLWGLVSFLTNYIPNVGFVVGLIPPALLALLASGPTTALLVVIVYIVLNVVIQVVLQPRFTGDAIGVTTTVSFLSLVFWAYAMGPLGALLALPMTLLAKSLLVDADPRARWINTFIATDYEPDRDSKDGDSANDVGDRHRDATRHRDEEHGDEAQHGDEAHAGAGGDAAPDSSDAPPAGATVAPAN